MPPGSTPQGTIGQVVERVPASYHRCTRGLTERPIHNRRAVIFGRTGLVTAIVLTQARYMDKPYLPETALTGHRPR